jgi:hypothetical protein
MRAGKSVAFLIPFNKTMASNYVRAKCLKGYEPDDWSFEFLDGLYPRLLDKKFLRAFYRIFFYTTRLFKLKFKYKKVVVIGVKQESILISYIVRKVLRLHLILDINDPYHSSQGLSRNKALRLLKSADYVIFESQEYKNYWNGDKIPDARVIEDTPQIECIYDDFLRREQSVIWVGSPSTSSVLLDFIPHLMLFNKFGYIIKLLGASDDIKQHLANSGVKVISDNYSDHASLVSNLTKSKLSFVPMIDIDLHKLRGNLKAKIAMGCGCLVIASKNQMHERLIENGKSGFLFDSLEELQILLESESNSNNFPEIALAGNNYVANKFTRANHAYKICEVADEIIEKS